MRDYRFADKTVKDKSVMIKMSYEDFLIIKGLADNHTDGNVSEWIRWAAKRPPKDEDFTDEDRKG